MAETAPKSDSPRGSQPRRSKIALACEECRARKVRCDGAQPVCGACRRRRGKARTACIYPAVPAGVSADYVAQLERRVRELEAVGRNVPQETLSTELANSDSIIDGYQKQAEIEELGHAPSPLTLPHDGRDGQLHLPPVAQYDPGVDGMGNIEGSESVAPEESSSAASFMNQIRKAIAARFSSSLRQNPSSLAHKEFSDPWIDASTNHLHRSTAELYVLPSRAKADDMMDIYWNEVHILYPFLLPHRFMESYRRLWMAEKDSSSDEMMYCILNLIFAITCQVTKRVSPSEKAAAAEVYRRRATHLLQVNLIGRGSIEIIQALLLMGQYLQSTEWPHRCSVVIGLAIRISQGMGLHLARTTESVQLQEERELARRLWHGCIFMDRVVSMTLGLPRVISRADALAVPFPACIDDKYLSNLPDSDNLQPECIRSQTEFYVQSLKLYIITEEVLSVMYSTEGTKEPATEKLVKVDFNNILKIDAALQDWQSSLPGELKIRRNVAEDRLSPVLSRQANILQLRYLQVNILLLRPVLSLLLAPEIRTRALSLSRVEACLPFAMALPCARKCFLSALEVIELIYDRQNWENLPMVEGLPAWWYEVFFTYTAATALIPARVYSYVRGDTSSAALAEGWQKALELLRRLSVLSPTAVGCLAALQMLNEELVFEDTGNHANLLRESTPATTVRQDSVRMTSHEAAMEDSTQLNDCNKPRLFFQTPDESILQIQDFTWFDYLPADLLTSDYMDFSQLSNPL